MDKMTGPAADALRRGAAHLRAGLYRGNSEYEQLIAFDVDASTVVGAKSDNHQFSVEKLVHMRCNDCKK